MIFNERHNTIQCKIDWVYTWLYGNKDQKTDLTALHMDKHIKYIKYILLCAINYVHVQLSPESKEQFQPGRRWGYEYANQVFLICIVMIINLQIKKAWFTYGFAWDI